MSFLLCEIADFLVVEVITEDLISSPSHVHAPVTLMTVENMLDLTWPHLAPQTHCLYLVVRSSTAASARGAAPHRSSPSISDPQTLRKCPL